jgi:hypothetical protein
MKSLFPTQSKSPGDLENRVAIAKRLECGGFSTAFARAMPNRLQRTTTHYNALQRTFLKNHSAIQTLTNPIPPHANQPKLFAICHLPSAICHLPSAICHRFKSFGCPPRVKSESHPVNLSQAQSRLVKIGQDWSRLVKVGQGWSRLVKPLFTPAGMTRNISPKMICPFPIRANSRN